MAKFTKLRRRAAEQLGEPLRPPQVENLSTVEIVNLIEDLRIHQTELEIQAEDLQQAQRRLELSRRQYKTLYDFAPVGYFTFNPRGVILMVNKTGAGQLGASPDRLFKQAFTDFIQPGSQDTFYLHCLQVLQTESRQSCELSLRRADGAPFEAQLESIPVQDEEGQGDRLQSALIDITQRNQLQAELAAERNLLRTLIDHLPVCVYVKDTECRFLMANQAVARMLDVEAVETLLGKTAFDFCPQPLAARIFDAEKEVMRSGQPLIDKVDSFTTAPGQRKWVSTTIVPLRSAAGSITGLVAVERDVTEQNRSQRRLKLLHSITQKISEAPDFHAALSGTLASIAETGRWAYGEAWTLDEAEQVLICSPAWSGSNKN